MLQAVTDDAVRGGTCRGPTVIHTCVGALCASVAGLPRKRMTQHASLSWVPHKAPSVPTAPMLAKGVVHVAVLAYRKDQFMLQAGQLNLDSPEPAMWRKS